MPANAIQARYGISSTAAKARMRAKSTKVISASRNSAPRIASAGTTWCIPKKTGDQTRFATICTAKTTSAGPRSVDPRALMIIASASPINM